MEATDLVERAEELLSRLGGGSHLTDEELLQRAAALPRKADLSAALEEAIKLREAMIPDLRGWSKPERQELLPHSLTLRVSQALLALQHELKQIRRIKDAERQRREAENQRRENDIWEYMGLGLGEPMPTSALHGRRAGDLLDKIISFFPERSEQPEEEEAYDEDQLAVIESLIDLDGKPPPRVAIVGRPNVGKSTLFNHLVGTDRAVVHDLAGTTRDAIDTLVETEDGPIVFVDTAGMRKRGKIDDSAEYYSLVRALRAIDDSDIALLVIDATIGVTGQDQRLSERVDASGCPIIIVLNKWEMVGPDARLEIQSEVKRKLAFLGDAPVLKISALSGKNVHKLHPLLQDSIRQYHKRVPTKSVNKIIGAAQQAQPANGGAKVLYAVQGATDPPTFTLFVNRELDRTYLRYLERRLREDLVLGSTPIKMRVRKRS